MSPTLLFIHLEHCDEDVAALSRVFGVLWIDAAVAAGARLAIRCRVLRLATLTSLAMALACSSQSQSTPATTIATSAGATEAAAGHEGHSMARHGNHDPRHGGVVYMDGDLHFEVVFSRGGRHRVYFSDAARAELPASTASEVTLTFSHGEAPGDTIQAEVDENGESWIAEGMPMKSATVARVAFVVNGEPYWIDVPYLEATDLERN